MGIGLTLVQRLVELHGGQVTAESAGPGQGAAFTVRLPLLPTPPSPTAKTLRATTPVGEGIRVLVVDDDYAVADSIAMLLELEGHEVRVANSGPAALAAAAEFEPHAVVLDIGMVGMDGVAVARHLRQQPQRRDLCIVAMSGYSDEEIRLAALEAGCDHYLVKPVDADDLLRLFAGLARPLGKL